MGLNVSDNKRFLVQDDGSPFFYLGDTAWELFHRLNREDAEIYLKDRARKGFTVIQCVVLSEFGGLTEPNAYGHLPLVDNNPTKPVEEYFEHVDWIVNKCAELGMYVGMLPTWGDKFNKKWGLGPEIFNTENAEFFGAYLAKRYNDKPIIYILGGDRFPEEQKHYDIIRSMATGIKENSNQLITYHPSGGASSSAYFFNDDWLDFYGIQSGHRFNNPNYELISADYMRTPVKPCVDLEPSYENLPPFSTIDGVGDFYPENGYMDHYEARKCCYWAIFSGSAGHTYGCNEVFQFYSKGKNKVLFSARIDWKEALNLPGAEQMGYARKLVESRPYLNMIPDNSLLLTENDDGIDRLQASRGECGSYAFIYTAKGTLLSIDTSKLSGNSLNVTWFNPRTGTFESTYKVVRNNNKMDFTPPTNGDGEDWILVLDDSSKGYKIT